MQGEKMLGVINARRENARNRQCTQKKYSDSTMYTEKCSESVIIYAERTLRNNKHATECPETTMYTEKTLGIVNASSSRW